MSTAVEIQMRMEYADIELKRLFEGFRRRYDSQLMRRYYLEIMGCEITNEAEAAFTQLRADIDRILSRQLLPATRRI